MKIWLKDEKTGIECGINNQGELFLGDDKSGYNLPDTPRNRQKMISDFCKQTGWQYPIIIRNGKPIGGEQGRVNVPHFMLQETQEIK